jgi:hypothetical protein
MKRVLIIFTLVLTGSTGMTQIPVELFSGHERTTVDIMFFKFFKNREQQNTRWLFFNRNRAGVDYRMTGNTYLPQFGFTEAVSYNHPRLKGFAPVAVTQIFNAGVYPKAGVQYALQQTHLTLFTWLVSETIRDTDIDWFVLFRYTPKISDRWNLFTQVELLNTLPVYENGAYSFTQRARLGLKHGAWQFGGGLDAVHTGKDVYTHTYNAGAFLRYEFQ